MWLRLRVNKDIEVNGELRHYHPGDWIEVGRQTGVRMLQAREGEAYESQGERATLIPLDSGVVVLGPQAPSAADALALAQPGLGVQVAEAPCLPYTRTLLWTPPALLRYELMAAGFSFLDTWEAAIPLFDYKVLAQSVGPEAQRQEAVAVLHDLRVPLYDTRLLYVQRSPSMVEVIHRWAEGCKPDYDPRLALLVALYQVKPVLLPLPCTWLGVEVE